MTHTQLTRLWVQPLTLILTFCSIYTAGQETTKTVYGVVGGKAALPCNLTSHILDDAVSLILWYKEDLTSPIYSLDARKGNLDQARHASSDSLATRSYFSTLQTNAHLLIENLTEDDAGEYRCRVDFRQARTRNFNVFLKVITPPEKPVIKDVADEVLPTLIGPFNEGDRLNLICETRGGKPRPSLQWWRESTMLDESYEITPSGMMRNILEIPVLQRHDLMAVFSCLASNNNISSAASTTVTVDLNFRPLMVTIDADKRKFSADKTVEVICRTAGSRPPATITWWKGSKALKRVKEKISDDTNVTLSILSFTPTADDSGKHLSCRSENALIPGSTIEDGFKLEIHYVPQLSLRLGSKLRHSHIQEGNDVYFDCNIRANPWVTEIRWWFEGKEIHTNTTAGVIVSNQSLVLQRVQRGSRGRYTCSATNSEGEGESNSVHLRVQYAPVCKTSQKILYGAARQESVKIHCEVDADPPEVTFRWSFNNSNENMDIVNHVPVEGGSSIATYVPRTELDYGTLFCYGKNGVGSQTEPCVFSIIPAGPPDQVRNCSVANQTEDSIRVDCNEGYDGGLAQHFVMEVRDTGMQRLQNNVSNQVPSLTAKGLPAGTSFLVVVYSANAKGRSKAVVITAATLALPESMNRMAKGNLWQLSFSPILALLIGVVLVLVIVAFVIVIILKLRTGSNRGRKTRDVKRDSKNKDKAEIPLRKASSEDVCDVCTCGGETEDTNCPDLLPGSHHGNLQLLESTDPTLNSTSCMTEDPDSKESLLGVNGTRVILVCAPSNQSPYNHPCLVYGVLPSRTGSEDMCHSDLTRQTHTPQMHHPLQTPALMNGMDSWPQNM